MNHTLLGPVASCKWDEIIPETKVIYTYNYIIYIYIYYSTIYDENML